MPDITTSAYAKTQLKLKGKYILPRTSIECVYDPKTGQPIDLSKIISINPDAIKTYTINGKSADNSGNFNITAGDVGAAASNHTHTASAIGAAAIDHTHTPESIGAANTSHTHEISEINGLEARLLSIDTGGGGDGISFDITPLTSQTYPEPSAWTNQGE